MKKTQFYLILLFCLSNCLGLASPAKGTTVHPGNADREEATLPTKHTTRFRKQPHGGFGFEGGPTFMTGCRKCFFSVLYRCPGASVVRSSSSGLIRLHW